MSNLDKNTLVNSKQPSDLNGVIASFSSDIFLLNSKIKDNEEVIKDKDEVIKNKNFEIAKLQRLLYGKKSEKSKTLKKTDLPLFDHYEVLTECEEKKEEEELAIRLKLIRKEQERLSKLEKKFSDTGKKKGRKLFSKTNPDLEVENIELDLNDAEKECDCGSKMTKIGTETSEVLEYIAAKTIIKTYHRNKYSCKACEIGVKIAPVQDKIFNKTGVSSSLLAYLIISKFVDHLPFYRLEKIFKRQGLNISRQLMENWFFKAACLLLPLRKKLQEELLKSSYVSCDETPLTMLDKNGKAYMWVYQSLEKKSLIYYDCCLNRKAENPQLFLKDYQGFVQSDGYSGYSFLNEQEGVTRLGCMAHARRKFYEIAKLVKSSKGITISHKVVNMMRELYVIEKEAKSKNLSNDAVQKLRIKRKAAIKLEKIKSYLDKEFLKLLPNSPLHKATIYFLNQYPYIKNYLEEGFLQIDNNKIENAIRPFAVGRKNWLFVGNEKGGKASSIMYSLIESAKLNNLEPLQYMSFLFDNIKKTEAENLNSLLPHLAKNHREWG